MNYIGQLVVACRRGDEAAFVRLSEEIYRSLQRTARFLLPDRSDAEDLVHDVILKLPIALFQIEYPDRIRAYMLRVLRRRLYDLLREKQRRVTVSMELVPAGEYPASAIATTPEDLGETEETLANMEQAMEEAATELGKNSQIVAIVEKKLSGFTFVDIAKELELPASTVKSQFYRVSKAAIKIYAKNEKART